MNYYEDIIVLLIQSLSAAWQITSEIQEYFFLFLKLIFFIFDCFCNFEKCIKANTYYI